MSAEQAERRNFHFKFRRSHVHILHQRHTSIINRCEAHYSIIPNKTKALLAFEEKTGELSEHYLYRERYKAHHSDIQIAKKMGIHRETVGILMRKAKIRKLSKKEIVARMTKDQRKTWINAVHTPIAEAKRQATRSTLFEKRRQGKEAQKALQPKAKLGRKPKISAETLRVLYEEQKLTMQQIAKLYEMSEQGIRKAIKRAGNIETRRAGNAQRYIDPKLRKQIIEAINSDPRYENLSAFEKASLSVITDDLKLEEVAQHLDHPISRARVQQSLHSGLKKLGLDTRLTTRNQPKPVSREIPVFIPPQVKAPDIHMFPKKHPRIKLPLSATIVRMKKTGSRAFHPFH